MPDELDGAAVRVLEWRKAALRAVCDVLEPWEYGTVARASASPRYWSFNLVRVEGQTPLGVEQLIAIADRALHGLAHRKIEFSHAAAAQPLRAAFEASGWKSDRLLWMRYEGEPATATLAVEEVSYDAVHPLRVAWHEEDFPGVDASEFHSQAREVAVRRNARVLAVRDGTDLVAYAQLEREGQDAEIADVYVRPEHRGHGLGTAVTQAAIAAAGAVRDLWICADDEDRPKHLYARLGFRPVWATMEFTRLPR